MNSKKNLIAVVLACLATSAYAHRPQIVPCDTYAQVAQEAAASRDSGKTLQEAQEALRTGHKWDTYYHSYQALVGDVFDDPALRVSSPSIVSLAASKGCQDHNAEERRIREMP